ncbi:MFS general substrate transporter [Gonapodya prolifera JEL478]|uniref:MFS general substrate transporter n=1 Tax=Gonapodya prolifera (strain JEL478) TaxID=1344416 RepID=A0A139AHF1_GONPJ|nr:MFS general substrate transporter [Gonapodya prolifera JEL478]|eukprot:KXS16236.1 MFS general substrate transporter [Gonapodya prolifera JEL478]
MITPDFAEQEKSHQPEAEADFSSPEETETQQATENDLETETSAEMEMGDGIGSSERLVLKLVDQEESNGDDSKKTLKSNPRAVAIAVASLSIGLMVSALDGTIVATMIPTIARDLDGTDSYQWIGTGYLLSFTALTPVWGKLSDIFGRKHLLLIMMLLFTVASALCALPTSMGMLIGSRVIQGVAGGGLQSLSSVIMGEIVSPLERGKYNGILVTRWPVGVTTGVCSIMGPFVGGVITDHLSWRWGFWINIPDGLLALVAYILTLHLPRPHGTLRAQLACVDILGILLSSASILLVLLAFTWGGVTYPWASGQIFGALAAAACVFGSFVAWEMRAREPVVPLALFKNWNYVLTMVIAFVLGWSSIALTFFVPSYFQNVIGLSATDSGALTITITAFVMPTGITVGIITSKKGTYVIFPQVGFALVTIGIGLCALLDENSGKWLQVLLQAICGVAFGMIIGTVQLMAQINAPDDLIGPGTTVAAFVRSLGGVMGIAGFATILGNVLADRSASGFAQVAVDYKLSSNQLGLFSASQAAKLSKTQVDLSTIPPEALSALRAVVQRGYISGLHYAFISAIPVCVVGFLSALLLKHVPLRNTANVQLDKKKSHH